MNKFWTKYYDNYKAICRLGTPILIGQLGMIFVGFADNIMVGRYSTEALASASFVNNIFNVAIFACIGFTYGLTPLVGALFTQKRNTKIGELLRNGLIINILFAFLVSAIMGVIYNNIDRMGQPEELLPLIRPYFLIYLAGLLPTTIFNVFAQWAFAINKPNLPMWVILISNALNVLGNWLLIYGKCGCPEMGLTGAGISTLIARIFGAIAIIFIFFTLKHYKEYRRGFIKGSINSTLSLQINRTSWPVALQMTLESGSFTVAAVMAGWLGAIELASFQVMVIVGTLGFCVYYSVAAAVSIVVSNANGLGNRQKMRNVAFAGYHLLLILATFTSVIFTIFGKYIIGAFSEDPLVIGMSISLILPLILYQYCDATQINFANALRGTANVMPMLWIAFIAYIVVGLPVTYILGFPCDLGIYGIFLSFSVSLFVAAVLFVYFFLRTTKPKS